MARYKPTAPFSVALALLIPTESSVAGVLTKTYPAEKDWVRFNGAFRTYGGTEKDVDGVLAVEDTAIIETWYRADIKSNCRVRVLQTGAEYEILGEPENIELRNQFMRFKVRRVKGGA